MEDLQRLSGGASRETWSFRRGDEALILQRERAGGIRTGGGMAAEADLVRAAGSVGVPVPEVVAAGADDGFGGSWMVTRRVPGETIARRILRDDAYAGGRAVLAGQCGEALARLHTLPVDAAPELHELDQVAQFREVLDTLGEPHPAFELGFRWLAEHRPPPSGRVVLHGDFRLGNLIVGPDGLRAVIDWELAHLGDPLEDLAWPCVRAWRFGGEPPVGGFGTREDLYGAYEAAGGRAVDPDAARWWEVLGTLKWGVMCIIQAATHLTGQSRSVELAAIGRRVCENEYDLLELIDPEGVAPAPTAAVEVADLGPHDAPSAGELAEAVREWVEGDVTQSLKGIATEGRVRFHARVVANVMAILERELSAGPAMAAAHAERLAALGMGSERELADAIEAGTIAAADRAVLDAVRATVTDKLWVANPRYLRH